MRILIILFACSIFVEISHNQHIIPNRNRNNACQTVEDFDTLDENENCWYNPEADISLVSI